MDNLRPMDAVEDTTQHLAISPLSSEDLVTMQRPGSQANSNSSESCEDNVNNHKLSDLKIHEFDTSRMASDHISRFQIQRQGVSGPKVCRHQEFHDNIQWHQRPVVKIKLSGLPSQIDTLHIQQIFQQYGSIQFIDIVQDPREQPKAFVTFKPAPTEDFWKHGRLRIPWMGREWRIGVSMMNVAYANVYEIGVTKKVYPQTLELSADSLDLGILYTPDSMKPFYQSQATASTPIVFRLDFHAQRIEVEFPFALHEQTATESESQATASLKYRFTIPLNAPLRFLTIGRTNRETSDAIVLIAESPPEFSRRYEQEVCHKAGQAKWQTNNTWYRVTDLGSASSQQADQPASLCSKNLNVNLGRWTTYRITFGDGVLQSDQAVQIFEALAHFNHQATHDPEFKIVTKEVPSVFELLESYTSESDWTSLGINALAEALYSTQIPLDFKVRYQLEVCISEGYLSEYNLGLEFLNKLQAMDVTQACGLLAGVVEGKQRIFEPMTIFSEIRIKTEKLNLPSHSFYGRSVVVTPTTMYLALPTLDVSNRVIRRYQEHTDRFLRVRFAEERPRGKLHSASGSDAMNQLYNRVKSVLMNGVVIGTRHYQFLAFGNSQLREHSAYFFCPAPGLFPETIREWMGSFDDKVVAKYAARLGQCFSTTRAVLGIKVSLGEMADDITADGKHTFTDGVGLISPFLAKIAASEIGVLTQDGESPSALQFRLGGCKGVLVVWPWQKQRMSHMIYLRPSQSKFHTEYQGLEINRWSQFSAAYLNRQLITILTTLGVQDSVFVNKLDRQIAQLDEAMTNPIMAIQLLQRDVDPHQISLELAKMVRNHFHAAGEPFMLSVLQLWRAYTIKWLKEKAKILIHKGAHLLGVIDEAKVLRGHFDMDQTHLQATHDPLGLPQIFIQLSYYDGDAESSKSRIIEGVVLLARNPSLHPGDVRVVRAVNASSLHHLKDVVVLPKTGDRDLASMCSGGDLDGDDFVVIWDEELIPPEWNHEAMDFTPPPPLVVEHPITVDDITSFFVQYVKNDNLGTVANAHLAWADQSPEGAKALPCLELANLHSIAVDYPKSGHAAVMPTQLRPKRWPHFMEKLRGSYHSTTALGQLYDRVELVNFKPDYTKSFDSRILDVAHVDEQIFQKITLIKAEYDRGIRRIMAQHGIEHELEVWSTFVLRHNGIVNNYKFNEEIGRLSAALKEATRNRCYEEAGGRMYEKIAPFVAAMYQVTNLQVRDALTGTGQEARFTNHSMPFISFPWIFSSVLGDIANGRPIVESTATIATPTVPPLAPILDNTTRSLVKSRKFSVQSPQEDEVIQTEEGSIHKGQMLDIFQHSDNTDHLEKAERLIAVGGSNGIHAANTNSEAPALKNGVESSSEIENQKLDAANLSPFKEEAEEETGRERVVKSEMSLLERLQQMLAK